MASRRRGKRLTHLEVVNRWCLDFYASEALDAFRDNDYTRFSQIRDHIQSLLAMPIEARSSVAMTLLVMQFLSRIYDGDKLDTTFEADSSISPLESAMSVLEMICAEVEVPQSDLERLQTSLREMAVIVCIKDKDFTKAKKVLQKYFPTSKNTTSKAKLLSDLVRQKCSTHPTLQQSYSKFRQNALDFIERVYTMPQPFLAMVVRKKIGTVAETQITRRRSQRLENGTQTENHTNHTDHTPEPQQEQNTAPEQSSVPPSSASSGFVSLHMLTKVYEVQVKREGLDVPFSSLMEEVYKEAQEEGKEEEQQQDQEGEEVRHTEVAEKIIDLMENLNEAARLGPVIEKETQEEEEDGEERQAAEEREEGELHLFLSESEILGAEVEVSHNEEKEDVEAMEEEEQRESEHQESEHQESEREREPDALVPPPLSLDPAPEEAVKEQHHQELESHREEDSREENTSVPAVAPPLVSPDPEVSMEEVQGSKQETQKGDTGGGERKEESVLDGEEDVSKEDMALAVLPPPPPSPDPLEYPFSETDSFSLLASTAQPTRSRPRPRRRVAPLAAQNGLDSTAQPQTPGSKCQDPVGPARPVANGPDAALGVQIIDARYCRVTVPQLIMMPDSQPEASPSPTTSDPKTSTPNFASEAEVSQLDEPQALPDSEAEETARTPPLVSTPRKRARRRLGNAFPGSPYKDSPVERSEELASALPKRGRKDPVTPGTSGATKGRRDSGAATSSGGRSNTPRHRKNTSSDTPVRGSPGSRLGKDTPPNRCSRSSPRSLMQSSDEEAPDSVSPGKKRRKEPATSISYRKMMNAPATKEVWDNEDSLFNTTRKSDDSRSLSNGKKRKWTDDETRWLKEGVARFGEGKWEKIRAAFPFEGRTGTNIKDRWRTLKNNHLV